MHLETILAILVTLFSVSSPASLFFVVAFSREIRYTRTILFFVLNRFAAGTSDRLQYCQLPSTAAVLQWRVNVPFRFRFRLLSRLTTFQRVSVIPATDAIPLLSCPSLCIRLFVLHSSRVGWSYLLSKATPFTALPRSRRHQ